MKLIIIGLSAMLTFTAIAGSETYKQQNENCEAFIAEIINSEIYFSSNDYAIDVFSDYANQKEDELYKTSASGSYSHLASQEEFERLSLARQCANYLGLRKMKEVIR